MPNNIYLIGPMGAGKTTVGRRLAALLGCDFVDTDRLLEERTGVSVSHIFEIEGEQGFRIRESKLLVEISQATQEIAVVSTGGGIILQESNREVMRESGIVVYLCAPAELLWRRLQNSKGRPLLEEEDPQSTIEKLLETREPLYAAQADFTVDVYALSSAQVAAKINTLLKLYEKR